jgi:hypothetical protein
MSTTAKIIIGVAIGVVILGVTCVGGIIALGVFVGGNTPEGISIVFEYPDDLVEGDEFDLVITVVNDLNQTRTLGDLDFYSPVLDGVRVKQIDPSPESDDSAYTFGMRTMVFNESIPPNGELKIALTMTAENAGFYTGDVDVTIDGMFSIYSTVQTIMIDESE